MRNKRAFDLVLTMAAAIVWVPVVLGASLLVLICSGRPVYYRSMRRISTGAPLKVVKFRTMVRNAAQIANRETVSVEEAGTRFLNISADSPLYTRIGRLLEKFALTELPQFTHVLKGEMSIIGNRPLPQNVMDCLAEEFDHVEDRFLTPAGLTGPSQLVGRDFISDADRLMLEAEYCRGALRSYSGLLDLKILVFTVLIVLRLKPGMQPTEVRDLIRRHTQGAEAPVVAPTRQVAPSAIPTVLPAPRTIEPVVSRPAARQTSAARVAAG